MSARFSDFLSDQKKRILALQEARLILEASNTQSTTENASAIGVSRPASYYSGLYRASQRMYSAGDLISMAQYILTGERYVPPMREEVDND